MRQVLEFDEIQREITSAVEQVRGFLNLEDWRIIQTLNDIPENPKAGAVCYVNPKYREAHIIFDPDKIETVDDVRRTVQHEMLHVFFHPFDTYREAVLKMISSDDLRLGEVEQEIWRQASESAVWQLNRLLEDVWEDGDDA